MSSDPTLVKDRHCGSCTVCCSALTINPLEIDKDHDSFCSSCVPGVGCTKYDTRPEICRTWHCLWRRMPTLDFNWRPDRSGVVGTMGGPEDGYDFTVTWDVLGPESVVTSRRMIDLVTNSIAAGAGVYLSAPARPGYISGKSLLNGVLGKIESDRGIEATRQIIWQELQNAKSMPQIPILP